MAVQTIEIPSHLVLHEEKRLDASFYTQDVIAATVVLEKLHQKGIPIKNIDQLSRDIFHRTRFKRKYVSEEMGLPFLTPTDIFMFPLRPRKHVIDPPNGLKVSPKWILITCSGTVGRCIISNSSISNCILSHDIIRVVPDNLEILGYLYVYLNTWIGQALLTKDQYGATVKHIEPHHVASIPIPIIEELKEKLNTKISEVYKLREEAQKLILKSEEMIYEELSLPKISENDADYYGGQKGRKIRAFSLRSSELNIRLDASFNKPILTLIRNLLKDREKNGIIAINTLSKLSSDIFTPPRFKRIYVANSLEGIPILHGGSIPWIKPLEIKYIWKLMKNIEKYIVNKNWILVTCSGTIGRTALVRDGWDKWTATNHMSRIITEKIHPGYLTAYLQSVYGQHQLTSLSYGGVVEEIGEAGELFDYVRIPVPSSIEVEKKIGNIVYQAYDKKDQANKIENQAIVELETYFEENTS